MKKFDQLMSSLFSMAHYSDSNVVRIIATFILGAIYTGAIVGMVFVEISIWLLVLLPIAHTAHTGNYQYMWFYLIILPFGIYKIGTIVR